MGLVIDEDFYIGQGKPRGKDSDAVDVLGESKGGGCWHDGKAVV